MQGSGNIPVLFVLDKKKPKPILLNPEWLLFLFSPFKNQTNIEPVGMTSCQKPSQLMCPVSNKVILIMSCMYSNHSNYLNLIKTNTKKRDYCFFFHWPNLKTERNMHWIYNWSALCIINTEGDHLQLFAVSPMLWPHKGEDNFFPLKFAQMDSL